MSSLWTDQLFSCSQDAWLIFRTGVGLALVKRIIEKHNGSISIESIGENTGTTFKLSIPIVVKGGEQLYRGEAITA